MAKTIEILEAFKPLVTPPHGRQSYTYFIYSSGRGCGKSYGIAQALILRATMAKIRILCIREVQKSLNESVKALLENVINDMELNSLFTVRHDSIECLNGSKFLFMGMRDANAVNVKSIADINITWIEEAEVLSKRSWELLIPSVTRTSNPQIVVSFNPRYEDDIIYKNFFIQKPPPKSFIKKLYPEDNPFFATSNLEVQRQHDYETLPESEYRHKWLGELVSLSEECIFTKEGFKKLRDGTNMPMTLDDFNRSNYSEVYVALDPATTSSESSNEFGCVVVGITKDGIYHIIGDYTGHHTPSDIAVLTAQLYHQFSADGVIVETNQGGDFIKHTLLEFNPSLYIIEVKATKDKIYRAAPLASLASLGKLKLLDIFTDPNRLITQMRNMTKRGYTGAKGSSPDALDAAAWGIYHLSGLATKFTAGSLFDLSYFDCDETYSFKGSGLQCIVAYDGVSSFTGIVFQIVQNQAVQTKLELLDCFNIEHAKTAEVTEQLLDGEFSCLGPELQSKLSELGRFETLFVPEMYGFENFNSIQISTYELETDKYDDQLMFILDCSKQKLLQFSAKPHSYQTYKSSRGEILKLELTKAKLGEKYESLVLRCLYSLCKLYF